MRVLVACERSGIIREAFRARGHDAWSCDLKPSRIPSQFHFACDVRRVLDRSWDLLIAHPVCRYLANSGVRWLIERPERFNLMRDGAAFYRLFDQCSHIPKRCVENPVMHRYALEAVGYADPKLRRQVIQYVQPHFFGAPFRKLTGLALHGLPRLHRTHWMKREDTKQAVWLMGPSPDREEKRSETYPEVARAMAEQWG